MKVKYKGASRNNYYGFNLIAGETYDFPDTMKHKVENNPDFEVSNGNRSGSKKSSVKKARSTRSRKQSND